MPDGTASRQGGTIPTARWSSFSVQLVLMERYIHGFPENTADVRIAQYETNARTPREELLKKLAQVLGVQKEILTVPVLTKPKEFSAAFFWMTEMGEGKFHL